MKNTFMPIPLKIVLQVIAEGDFLVHNSLK